MPTPRIRVTRYGALGLSGLASLAKGVWCRVQALAIGAHLQHFVFEGIVALGVVPAENGFHLRDFQLYPCFPARRLGARFGGSEFLFGLADVGELQVQFMPEEYGAFCWPRGLFFAPEGEFIDELRGLPPQDPGNHLLPCKEEGSDLRGFTLDVLYLVVACRRQAEIPELGGRGLQ